ncbi:MAG TPA: DEAD/DEAH box helicase [Acidimicrobiales bacterium]|nr:DEAD/DEAH box helicase [Acidimicrobiales bacterium]
MAAPRLDYIEVDDLPVADRLFVNRLRHIDPAAWTDAIRRRLDELGQTQAVPGDPAYSDAVQLERARLESAPTLLRASRNGFLLRPGAHRNEARRIIDRPNCRPVWRNASGDWELPLAAAPIVAAAARALPGVPVTADAAERLRAHHPRVEATSKGFVVEGVLGAEETAILRAVCAGKYQRGAGTWFVDHDHAADLATLATHWRTDPAVRSMLRDARAEAEARAAAATATTGSVVVPGLVGDVTLRLFQAAAVSYAASRRRVLIADEVGLGKTLTALSAAAVAGALPVLVICAATMKLTWAAEISEKFPDWSVHVISGTARRARPGATVTIVNYDLCAALLDDLLALEYRCLIADESHRVKEFAASEGAGKKSGTKRTAAVRTLAHSTPEDGLRLLLTATPTPNGRPRELFPQLDILGYGDLFGGWHQYADRWCAARKIGNRTDTSGSSNELELNRLLIERCMVRRTKADVLPELPPVQTRPLLLPIEGSGATEYRAAETDIVAFLAARAAELAIAEGRNPTTAAKIAAIKAEAAEHLVRMSTLRQLAAAAKMRALREWIDTFLLSGEKLVVFAHFKSTQRALIDAYDAESILAASEQKPLDVQAAKERFQTDPDCKIIVCSSEGAREGHTLTAASTVLVAELPFREADLRQMVGRCWGRLNDLHGATLALAIGKGTIDERIWKLLNTKGAVSDAVVDGKAITDAQRRSEEANMVENLLADYLDG